MPKDARYWSKIEVESYYHHCNNVKSGGPTCISQHDPQQFHDW